MGDTDEKQQEVEQETMRDYFAVRAMQAMLSAYPPLCMAECDFEALAGDSYSMADEMLKARES